MKTIALIIIFLFPFFADAQPIDTIAVTGQVDSMIQISRQFTNMKDFDKAMQINMELEKTALEKLGRKSAAYGRACFNHGRILHIKAEYKEAEQWYLESLEVNGTVSGKRNLDYASALSNLSVLYAAMGLNDKAEPLYLEALDIRGEVLGEENPSYLTTLSNLAIFYKNIGKTEQAEPLYIKAKDLREKVLGKEHPDYANSLDNLAMLYIKTGRYELAEPLLKEAKAIREKTLGATHPSYFSSLTNLAVLFMETGRYEQAEPLYLEAKSLLEQTLTAGDPNYSKSLNNLANLYWKIGDYEKVEPLYKEAISNLEISAGKEHLDYAVYLNNLATFYTTVGDMEKAEAISIEVIGIQEKSMGRAHAGFAPSLNNLATLYKMTGQNEKALPLYLEAKTIHETNSDQNDAPYALNLANLSSLYLTTGELVKAEPLALEASTRYEKLFGKMHPDYALSLHNMADVYHALGQSGKAETLYLEALSIYDKSVGRATSDYTECLYDLINFYQAIGNYDKAGPLGTELSKLSQTIIARGVHYLSELELNKYLLTFSKYRNQIFSLVENRDDMDAGNVGACFENSLFYKGFLLQAANQIRYLSFSDSTATAQFDLLKSYKRRLAAEYAKPAGERATVASLEEKANSLEKDLARTVAGFGEAMQQVTWQEVQQKLLPNEAAIEFVHFQYFGKNQTDSTLYVALLLRPGFVQPQFIPLFEEKSLDSLLMTNGERKADYVNNLYAVAGRGAKAIGKPQKSLYEMLWKPLENGLDGVQTIYFSPTGLLHRLHLGAIPMGDETTIADQYRLIEMGSTRQLVVPSDLQKTDQHALLLGGIEYELDTTNMEAAILAGSGGNGSGDGFKLPSNFITGPDLRGGHWDYLKWTDKEVTALGTILKADGYQTATMKGYDASEEFFKTIGQGKPSPRILHIATHGFFFPDPEGERSERGGEGSVFKMSEHPMIRSGLLLAGGNYAWENSRTFRPDMEDGILTAYEIAQMDLSNTELVVLSACETGLGDIQGNEGVYGLQRAFKIAGAKYLIMSLWQVPDYQTQELMTDFYSKWLEGKMAIPDAFRSAQLEMRDKYQNPYFWAGFVLVE